MNHEDDNLLLRENGLKMRSELELLRYFVQAEFPKNSLRLACVEFLKMGLRFSGANFYGSLRIRFSQA